jgi:drug/metabolite transporter (DMT)-like permease
LVLLSFTAVYLLWGSTYFFIRIGIESVPPLVLSAMRHTTMGLVFYPISRLVTREKPTRPQWGTAILTGLLLLLCGNGAVSWSETRVPSGIAALLVATVSLWMVTLDWLRPGGVRPAPRARLGFALGFVGIGLLVGPAHLGGSERVNLTGSAILLLGSLAWATGSIYSRHHPLPHSPQLAVGMQSLAGGAGLWLLATLSGEVRDFHPSQVPLRAWLAILYLVVFGSAIGFSAYVYILRHSTASRVATYAFINPVVALLLGWLLLGEPLTRRTLLASGTILAAVLLVITAPPSPSIAPTEQEIIPIPGEA